MSLTLAIMIGAAVGGFCGAVVWRAARASNKSVASNVTNPEPIEAPRVSVPPSGAVSADAVAAAVAARLRHDNRPLRDEPFVYPPYDLGGSLERLEFRDVFLTFREWRPVKNAKDVAIDWSRFASADLVVDAFVKGTHGTCYLGLWDVANSVVVAESRPVAVDMTEQHVSFSIPREAGTKTYRLVTRGSNDGSTALFGATGQISFPIYLLGGSATLWKPPSADGWQTVPNAHEVEIDWTHLGEPINKVILDASILVSDYSADEKQIPPTGRARLRLRDLNTDRTVVECDWVAAGRRSMHHSYWPKLGTCRHQLPGGSGKAKYVLEVAISGPAVSVAITGRLLLRH